MEIEYRKLKPGDSRSYRIIRLESLNKYPDHFFSTFEEQSIKYKLGFETYIEKESPDKFILGAFHDGELVGICGFYRLDLEKSNHRGEIVQMYVQPEFQGNGIGYKMLEETLIEAFTSQGLEQIELGVTGVNKSANKIYEKIGFEEYGLQKQFIKVEETYYDQRLMVIFKKDFEERMKSRKFAQRES